MFHIATSYHRFINPTFAKSLNGKTSPCLTVEVEIGAGSIIACPFIAVRLKFGGYQVCAQRAARMSQRAVLLLIAEMADASAQLFAQPVGALSHESRLLLVQARPAEGNDGASHRCQYLFLLLLRHFLDDFLLP